MRRWTSLFAVAGVCVTAALLAGCAGNGGSQLAPTGSAAKLTHVSGNHRVDLFQTLVTPRSVRPNFNRHVKDAKLVKPNCCALQKTLFASDAFGGTNLTGAIYMFDYVTGTFLGQVAPPPEGFLEVQGGCSEISSGGNVYFANTSMSTIDEYNHSGTYVATITDPGQYPVGCSYDRTTGNLAVSNIISSSGGSGSVSIFDGGTLVNTCTFPNVARAYFLGYEGKTGRLWVDGYDSSGVFQYGYFFDTTGACKFTSVTISGATIGFPGMVQWSAKTKYMNVGDQDTFSAPTIYQVDDLGNVKGETVLTCEQPSDLCDVVQGSIKGPGIVAGDSIARTLARFLYPAGGAPILEYIVPGGGFVQPLGTAISPNKM